MKKRYVPKNIRDKVKAKFNGHCGYCGEKPDRLCIDHIHPFSDYRKGEEINNIENLMPSCFKCNNYKLTWSLEQFRSNLQDQVKLARRHSVNFRFAEKYGLIEVKEKPIKFYFERTK